MDDCRKRNIFERVEFALFLKVLIKLLNDDQRYMMVRNVKIIVLQSTRGNRTGDPSFNPLIGSIVVRLRRLVGDYYWKRSMEYTKWYIRRQNNRYQVRKFYEVEHAKAEAALEESRKKSSPPMIVTTTSAPSPRPPIIGI